LSLRCIASFLHKSFWNNEPFKNMGAILTSSGEHAIKMWKAHPTPAPRILH
jgi:hypothetical protein